MVEQATTARIGRFEVRTTSDSHFGWLRTRLSLERTMRTATALIGPGFTASVLVVGSLAVEPTICLDSQGEKRSECNHALAVGGLLICIADTPMKQMPHFLRRVASQFW